jgi:hypothetical protein
LNAERRLPRSTVLVATATIRVVATEGQIYDRQPQQAGDNQSVAFSQRGQGVIEPRARPVSAGEAVVKINPLIADPEVTRDLPLCGEVLLLG